MLLLQLRSLHQQICGATLARVDDSPCSLNAMQAAAAVPEAGAAAASVGAAHLYSISGMSDILGCSSQPSPQLLDATSSAASCTPAPNLCCSVQYLSLGDSIAVPPAHRIRSTSASGRHMPGFSVASSMQSGGWLHLQEGLRGDQPPARDLLPHVVRDGRPRPPRRIPSAPNTGHQAPQPPAGAA